MRAGVALFCVIWCLAHEGVCQATAVPRPRTIHEAARRVRGTSANDLRVLERGAPRALDAADDAPFARDLVLVRPDKPHTIASGARAWVTLPFKIQLVDSTTLAVTDYWPVIQPAREALEFDAASRQPAYRSTTWDRRSPSLR
jgi:hypothetical protein